ncbi:MAG: iron dicitrate transport regulator FecR [Rhodoferax sp.]|nr:iron dicitrate transport regulator FecR [Rhodoferax sp.]
MKHTLNGRTEQELLWYQRRQFLSAAAAWTAAGGFSAAYAQQRSNIVELVGDAQLNGARLLPGQTIQTGDELTTGPGTTLVFVIGNASFKVRQNTRMAVERGSSLWSVSILRLLTGGVASVWGKGTNRQIVTPTMTAGIRGTGVYTESFGKENVRSYFCNCYGTVDLSSGDDKLKSQADYHQAFWADSQPKEGRYLSAAAAINHADEELEMLARLVGQRTAWQAMGKKGVKDGRGYMEEKPGQLHPAQAPQR